MRAAYEEAAQHNWSREEYDAYIYAGIREQDEKGRIELAEKRAKYEQLVELVLNLHANGVPLAIIAKSINKAEQEVTQIIENQKNE